MPPPFRLRTEIPRERDIHKAVAHLLDNCLLAPAVWAPYPAGAAQLSPQQQAAYARVGLKRGWPDCLVLYQGKTFGLELKRPGAALSRTRVGRTGAFAVPATDPGESSLFFWLTGPSPADSDRPPHLTPIIQDLQAPASRGYSAVERAACSQPAPP